VGSKRVIEDYKIDDTRKKKNNLKLQCSFFSCRLNLSDICVWASFFIFILVVNVFSTPNVVVVPNQNSFSVCEGFGTVHSMACLALGEWDPRFVMLCCGAGLIQYLRVYHIWLLTREGPKRSTLMMTLVSDHVMMIIVGVVGWGTHCLRGFFTTSSFLSSKIHFITIWNFICLLTLMSHDL